MYVFKMFKMTCREATLLSARIPSGKLPVFSSVRYWLHLFICSACRRFGKQADTICRAAKRGDSGFPEACPGHLKAKIISQMREED